MGERRGGAERRVFSRYTMDRGVQISDGERRHGGRLQDISGGGASIQTDDDEDFGDPLAAGAQIDIDVDDLGFYGGQVIRDLEEGYAVRFDMDDAERDELVTEIMQHGIALDD